MTPKEQAAKLVDKYYIALQKGINGLGANNTLKQIIDHAKKCALIAVEEILPVAKVADQNTHAWVKDELSFETYWLEVKKEIKLI